MPGKRKLSVCFCWAHLLNREWCVWTWAAFLGGPLRNAASFAFTTGDRMITGVVDATASPERHQAALALFCGSLTDQGRLVAVDTVRVRVMRYAKTAYDVLALAASELAEALEVCGGLPLTLHKVPGNQPNAMAVAVGGVGVKLAVDADGWSEEYVAHLEAARRALLLVGVHVKASIAEHGIVVEYLEATAFQTRE